MDPASAAAAAAAGGAAAAATHHPHLSDAYASDYGLSRYFYIFKNI